MKQALVPLGDGQTNDGMRKTIGTRAFLVPIVLVAMLQTAEAWPSCCDRDDEPCF